MTKDDKKAISIPKRVKKTYSFLPNIVEMIATHKYVANDCELDFVSTAIKNYCADIDGERSMDAFCDRIYKFIRAEQKDKVNRYAHNMFKIAVELCKLNYLIGADFLSMTDSEMKSLDSRACDTVRKHRGFVYLYDAIEEEKKMMERK